jgi:hypothetical protein
VDQLIQYQNIIKEVLQGFIKRHHVSTSDDDIETLLITDDDHGHYMVIKNGWRGKDRVQHIPIFVRIVDGKIWVEEDWTDYEVVDRLLKAGIPQEDIVLAFHHPSMRQYADFTIPEVESS